MTPEEEDALVHEHRRLVYWTLRRFRLIERSPDPVQTESTGFLALLHAIRTHDPLRASFATFAVRLIRQSCWKELNRQRKRTSRETPLEVFSQDGEPLERPEASISPDRETDVAARQVAELLRQLPPRDAQLLALRFGIGDREHSTEELSAKLGVSGTRVNLCQSKALSRLRALANKKDPFAAIAARQQARIDSQSRQ